MYVHIYFNDSTFAEYTEISGWRIINDSYQFFRKGEKGSVITPRHNVSILEIYEGEPSAEENEDETDEGDERELWDGEHLEFSLDNDGYVRVCYSDGGFACYLSPYRSESDLEGAESAFADDLTITREEAVLLTNAVTVALRGVSSYEVHSLKWVWYNDGSWDEGELVEK